MQHKDPIEEREQGLQEDTQDVNDAQPADTQAGTGEDLQGDGGLQAQVDELKDKYLRLYAEFDNFRKRSAKERIELVGTAAKDTLSALLPVLDDFDRAKQAAEQTGSDQFPEGVKLVYNKLQQILQQRGLEALVSDGADFDPEFHEAITDIPAPSPEWQGKVVDTIEKGYFLNGKLIRFAKVVVGR